MRSLREILRSGSDEKFTLTGKAIAVLCIAAALLGLAVPLALGKTSLAILGSYLAIPLLLAPLIFFRIRSAGPGEDGKRGRDHLFPLLVIAFSVLFVLSAISLVSTPVRGLPYYLLVTGMGMCILLEILFARPSGARIPVLLAQTGIAYLNIVWGVTLKYYFYIGRTDPIGHAWLVENLLLHGHITPVFSEYQRFPLWHILCAMSSLLFGILPEARQVMYILNGLVYAVVLIMVYLIARRLGSGGRMALLAALFTAFSVGVIDNGMSSFPRSAVLVLVLVLFYLTLIATTPVHAGLILLVTLSTILFHTVSMPFIVLILLIMYLLQALYRDDRRQEFIRLPYLAMMMVMTLVYWVFFAPYLFGLVVRALAIAAPSRMAGSGALSVPLPELFNYLEYLPLLLFLVLGVLAVLSTSRASFPLKIFCLTGFLMIPVAFPGPALLISRLGRNFDLFRFQGYAFLFISLAAAVGFLYLFRRTNRYGKAAVILLFVLLCLLSVSNDFTASDNPLMKRQFYTFYLTRPEVTGFDRLVPITDGLVLTDYVTDRYYKHSPFSPNTTILQVNAITSTILKNQSTDLVLVRSHELTGRPVRFLKSPSGTFIYNPDYTENTDYFFQGD
ncbi:MAG: hypothetical protein LUO86_00525, partial [Methanomicrobiales archaeon]|nr:hypothetical protein [Methanomicrobiales archaeon]